MYRLTKKTMSPRSVWKGPFVDVCLLRRLAREKKKAFESARGAVAGSDAGKSSAKGEPSAVKGAKKQGGGKDEMRSEFFEILVVIAWFVMLFCVDYLFSG
ncbi:hypothetical protein QJS10_CPB11g01325 [Acorus calamus]|uniref:Transmembrane protein n=1 Tax=Acorus calamus TaxID=4465 RepID=A0AAV9DW38_ACOCL|nr:hypothetical protein QJS10_CPB11g01325 [Acorus calamus]